MSENDRARKSLSDYLSEDKDATIAALQSRIVNTDTELDKQKELNSSLREKVERLNTESLNWQKQFRMDCAAINTLEEINAALKSRAEAAEAERDALREKVEKVRELRQEIIEQSFDIGYSQLEERLEQILVKP